MPQDTELEEYQNKELQKGAVLAQGILLYELSRFRAMEKIMHRPEEVAEGLGVRGLSSRHATSIHPRGQGES